MIPHTVDPTIPWEEWSDLFSFSYKCKGKRRYRLSTHSDQKTPTNSISTRKSDGVRIGNQRTAQLERNIREQKRHDDEEAASIKSETDRFNVMRIDKATRNFAQSSI